MDVDLVQCTQVVHIMVEINASKDCSAGQKILLLSSSALLTIFPFFPQLTHFHGFLRHSAMAMNIPCLCLQISLNFILLQQSLYSCYFNYQQLTCIPID